MAQRAQNADSKLPEKKVTVSQSSPALGKAKFMKPQQKAHNPRRFSDSDQNDPEIASMRKMIYDLPFYALPGLGSDFKNMSRTWSKGNFAKIQTMQKDRKSADSAPIPDEIVHPDSYGITFRLVLAVLAVLCGSFMAGFNIGCMNTMSKDVKKALNIDSDDKTYSWSLVSSLFAVGGGIGAFIGGSIVNKLGRKNTLSIASFFMVGSVVLEFYSSSDWMMWIAR